MGYWRRHPKKDLERLLEQFHASGWVIKDSDTYYKVLCPCGEHRRTIHLSPSGSQYRRNAESWLRRQPCGRKPETENGGQQ